MSDLSKMIDIARRLMDERDKAISGSELALKQLFEIREEMESAISALSQQGIPRGTNLVNGIRMLADRVLTEKAQK